MPELRQCFHCLTKRTKEPGRRPSRPGASVARYDCLGDFEGASNRDGAARTPRAQWQVTPAKRPAAKHSSNLATSARKHPEHNPKKKKAAAPISNAMRQVVGHKSAPEKPEKAAGVISVRYEFGHAPGKRAKTASYDASVEKFSERKRLPKNAPTPSQRYDRIVGTRFQ